MSPAECLTHYRAIEAQLRVEGLFQDFVHNLAMTLHDAPAIEREATIMDEANLVKAITELFAETRGMAFDERDLSDIASAVVADARRLFARMPPSGGNA